MIKTADKPNRESGTKSLNKDEQSTARNWNLDSRLVKIVTPIHLFFAFVLVGLAISAILGGPLSWDGSNYLFKILDKQSPYVPYGRLMNVVLHYPIILASNITNNISVLQLLFNFIYVSIPLVALYLAWWMVKDYSKNLFIWPVLGIGLVTLLGQLFFVSEAIIAVQLFWTVFLGTLLRFPKQKVPVVVLVSAVIYFIHPFAILLFAIASMLCVALLLINKQSRLLYTTWAIAFTILSVTAFLRFTGAQNSYEYQQLSMDLLQTQFNTALAGWPFRVLELIWIVSIFVFAAPFLSRIKSRMRISITHALQISLILVAGGLLVVWALDPYQWNKAFDYRAFPVFTSIPLMGLAFFESIIGKGQNLSLFWAKRSSIILLVGAIFFIVLSIQSFGWFNLSNQLREALPANAKACYSQNDIEWIANSPIDHWSVTPYSLLLQGKEPHSIVVSKGITCSESISSVGVVITHYNPDSQDIHKWNSSWFNLQRLKEIGKG
ncbi:MAG TPA: hypothetical protein VH186_05515 [Chloroflexia bacterium]|nr:hypothetical protein [Chloroflexia bacterium]